MEPQQTTQPTVAESEIVSPAPTVAETTAPKKELLSIGQLLKNARTFYKDNFKKLWLLFLLGGIGSFNLRFSSSGGTNSLESHFQHFSLPVVIAVIVVVAILMLFVFLSHIALLKSISDVHKGQFTNLKGAYKKASYLFFPFILLNIINAVTLLGGFLLFIIPGMILAGYFIFTQLEFFDEDKRNFAAFLGSWALIKNYWWDIVWKIVGAFLLVWAITGVSAGLLAGMSVVAGILLAKISSVIGTILLVVMVVAIILVVVMYVQPLLTIFLFELYYNLKAVRQAELPVDPALQAKRKKKIIALMIIAVLGLFPIAYSLNKASYYVEQLAAQQRAAKQMNSLGNPSTATSSQAVSSTASTVLQKTPFMSAEGGFQINLPSDWVFVGSTTTVSSLRDKSFLFGKEDSDSLFNISSINMANVRKTLPQKSDEEITAALSQAEVTAVKGQFTQLGLKGFQVSDLKKQAYGDDTAYVYRGSAAFGAPDHAVYDFESITIFNKDHGYQLLAIWPESEYGWSATALLNSLATFKITK